MTATSLQGFVPFHSGVIFTIEGCRRATLNSLLGYLVEKVEVGGVEEASLDFKLQVNFVDPTKHTAGSFSVMLDQSRANQQN